MHSFLVNIEGLSRRKFRKRKAFFETAIKALTYHKLIQMRARAVGERILVRRAFSWAKWTIHVVRVCENLSNQESASTASPTGSPAGYCETYKPSSVGKWYLPGGNPAFLISTPRFLMVLEER